MASRSITSSAGSVPCSERGEGDGEVLPVPKDCALHPSVLGMGSGGVEPAAHVVGCGVSVYEPRAHG